MDINTVSGDRGSFASLATRPSASRDDAPSLIDSVKSYLEASSAPMTADGDAPDATRLLTGGSAKPDFRAIAEAMLARLSALRDNSTASARGDSANDAGAADSGSARSYGSAHGWHYHTHGPSGWGSGGGSGGATTAPPPSAPPAAPSDGETNTPPPSDPTLPAPSTRPPTPPPTPPPPPVPPMGSLTPSDPISLDDGATTIANTSITGATGIVGDNATHVTTLDVSNVIIHSTNYGIYLGQCDNLNLSHADITCDPNGGDSYSIRGNITHLVSADSTYRSGIKAFRIYGCEGGSSTRDTISGDRLMLGGGYADEWGPAGPFHNFTFTDDHIAVNSVEMYNDTNNVTFDNVDFAGTDHISIQAGAHDITFRNCRNLPEIRLYDASGNRMAWPADASRNIAVIN